MEIDRVIKLRNKLKAGLNLPLKVYIDNAFTIFDESAVGHFTKWDDTNGFLYSFRFVNTTYDKLPSDAEGIISAFAVDYASIQDMEIANLKLSDLSTVIDSIGGFSNDFKRVITDYYTMALDPNNFNINREEINKLLSAGLDTTDDYYNGKMVQSRQETLRYKEHNKLVDDAIQAKKDEPGYEESPIDLGNK